MAKDRSVSGATAWRGSLLTLIAERTERMSSRADGAASLVRVTASTTTVDRPMTEPLQAGVVVVLPWLLSAITIWMTVLAGNKSRWAWAVGLGNQGLWLVWIVASASWGLLPMNAALWAVYARNHLKWKAA